MHQQKDKPNYQSDANGFCTKLTKSEGASKSFQEYSSKIRSVVTHLVVAQLSELRETEQSSLSEGNYHVMLAQRPVKKQAISLSLLTKG